MKSKDGFPRAAVVKLQDSSGWDSIDDPLVARFKIEIPGFASVTGKRMLLPAFFFSTLQKNMFTSQFRRYPITFPFPFTEEDELTVELPEGYAVEEPPYRRKIGLSYAGYEISSQLKDRELTTGAIGFQRNRSYRRKNMRSLKTFSAWSKKEMRATPSCGASKMKSRKI